MPSLPPILLELQAKAGEALAALDETDRRTAKLGTESAGHLQKFSAVGRAALLGIGGAALVVGGYSLEMADQFEKAQARLETAVANAGGSFAALKPQLDAVIDQMGKFGYTSTVTESALSDLTAATHNPSAALGQMGLAADIARGRNISLADATHLLVYAQTGHVAMLSRLGIQVKDNNGKLLDAHDALGKLAQMYGGAASRNADTFAGKTEALKAQAANLATQLGMALVPILEKVMSVTESVVGWFERHKTIAEALGIVIGGVLVAAIGVYIAGLAVAAAESAAQFALMIAKGLAWVAASVTGAETVAVANDASAIATAAAWVAANATMILAGGGILLLLVGLAAGAYELYKHWDTVWSGIKAVALAVWHFLDGEVIQPIVGAFEWLWHGIETVGGDLFGFLKTWGPVALEVLVPFIGIPLLIFTHFSQIEGYLSTAWHAAVQAVETGVHDAVGWVAGLPGRILHALGDLGSLLIDAGKQLIHGFVNGIEGAFDDVKNTLGHLTGMLTSWKGPPDVDRMLLHGSGQLVIQGFINGLESKYGDVHSTLQRFTANVRPTITAAVMPAASSGAVTTAAASVAGVGDMVTSTAAGVTTIAPHVEITVHGNLDQVTLDQVEAVATAAARTLGARIVQEQTAGRR